MDEQRRNALEQRWQEIDRELADIADCKSARLRDPPKRQADLLIEQAELEHELADSCFGERDEIEE
jgi:hypothetical protein